MTDEERRIITSFVERMSGAAPIAQAPSGPWGATGPAQVPNLPPVDPEADRLINDLFARHPEARYRITQSAFVQEAALIEAQNRLQQLEWEVENARRQGQAATAQASAQGGGGMFGGLFGGARQAGPAMPPPMPPRPQAKYPPGYNPQAMQAQQQRGGMGFLGTAAAAAAGVAGGMLIGNMLMGAMGGGTAEAATSPFETGGADATPASAPADAGWGGQDAAPVDDGWGAGDTGGDWGDEEI